MKIQTLLGAFSLLAFSLHAQTGATTEIKAGYRSLHFADSSRLFKPDTKPGDSLHFRPVDVDVWYPASIAKNDTAWLYKDLLGLLEQRANAYAGKNIAVGITADIAKSFAKMFKCSDASGVLSFRTKSFSNAQPIAGRLPVVLYLTSFNAMCYENFLFFEELAQRGYFVISVSSIGTYPGDMTMKYANLIEQVMDAVSAIDHVKTFNDLDLSKLGIIGFSWGGLAGALTASKLTKTACLVSLDGSEYHYYGNSSEDKDFETIVKSSEFSNLNLSIPYLRLQSTSRTVTDKTKSIYNFSHKLSGQKYIYQVKSASHLDFSSIPTMVKSAGNCPAPKTYSTILDLTLCFLDEHLKEKKLFDEKLNTEVHKTIRNKAGTK